MKKVVQAAVATGVTLVSVEALLRLTGMGPWQRFEDFEALPRLSSPHPTRGWALQRGEHRYTTARRDLRVTLTPHGRAPSGGNTLPELSVYGGSFAMGYGLDDSEVFTTHLGMQTGRSVHNHGVPGYGTVQSLRSYQEEPCGQVVLYLLNELHDARNVAAPSWLWGLDRSGSHTAWTQVPRVVWDGEQLVDHGLQRYRHWTLSEHMALIDRVERASLALRDRGYRTKAETTMQLITRFRDAAVADGARFVVAVVDAPSRGAYYLDTLEERGVEAWDWRSHLTDRLDDGHPGPSTHRAWARAVMDRL